MKRNFLTYLPFLLFISLIIALDQWTKSLVREHIPFGGSWLPEGLQWLSPYARIVHWKNSGAAFGLFQNGNAIFTVLAIVVIAAIFYYYPLVDRADWGLRIAMGLQTAGATGNLIDRLMHQEVTDFISVGTFPVFNVADASITVGVGVLLLGALIAWFKERADARSPQPLTINDPPEGTDPKIS